MRRRVPFAAAILLVLLTPLGARAQEFIRVGCFSPQRAFAESADGKAVVARLTTLQNQKTLAIEAKNRALDAARASQSGDVEKLRIDVQRFIEDAQAELMGIQRDAENAFLVKLKPALDKVVADKGLQLVFNVDGPQVVWFDPVLDITPDVVKQLIARSGGAPQ